MSISLRTDEASWSLLNHLHAERTRHVRLVTVAFDGDVFSAIETLVGSAAVVSFSILLRRALIAAYG